jgi:hypothetical protein
MTIVDITTVPLTFAEEAELAQLEHQIENGIRTFMQVGSALVTINENKLYRATHSTFIEYAKDRFGLTGSYAYRVMAGAKVVTELPSPIGDIITVESQARELVGLPTKQAAEVLIEAIDTTGGKPTAEAIRAARLNQNTAPESTRPYIGPPPIRQSRKPLPESVRAAMFDLEKVVARLVKLQQDDRWNRNRDHLASSTVGRLSTLCGELTEVLDDLRYGPMVD